VADHLEPVPGLRIPRSEIELRASRSSGPGGQHANVTASRVEAIFDVWASQTLSDEQKRRIAARCGPRVRAVSQRTRSQSRNRELAIERIGERLARALRPRKRRRPTRPGRAAERRRLEAKRKRGERKRERRKPRGEWQ
jgi:ribosome-associated protein